MVWIQSNHLYCARSKWAFQCTCTNSYRVHRELLPLTEPVFVGQGVYVNAGNMALTPMGDGQYRADGGKYYIGICTHAIYEAVDHAAVRFLFKHYVTDFPHIRQPFVDANTRLCAMRMFATRAADYMRSASAADRRYLLYNPMVKMKVTTQGEEVINLLWDVIAAKGFEKDTYFEMAATTNTCDEVMRGLSIFRS